MKIRVISVPYDSGLLRTRMGAGPDRLLSAGLADRLRGSGHQVREEECVRPAATLHTEVTSAFALNGVISAHVREATANGEFPLVLAGNCIASTGVLAGLGIERIRVAWFDAHGDFNTPETTIGGFLDGMALSIATGHCWSQMASGIRGFRPIEEKDVLLIGARDLDVLEAELLADSAITTVAASETAERLDSVLQRSMPSTADAYVHVDLDVLDPSQGRVNEFAAGGGLSVEEVEAILRLIGRRCHLRAAAITAYDPSYDVDGRICEAALRLIQVIAEVVSE
ncbi:MAG: arginase family protein [Gemmatimonadaceae bacterium]|nr:arginase family protein [Gemmatimonadaceae bacterium]MDQ3518226.1 arginase family protein [Gemmatimonadota bacterium]